jgi:hypothetical protein
MAQFTLGKGTLVKGFQGYGAQLNQNVFAPVTRDLGVTDAHLKKLDQHVHKLAPRFVRVFFDPRARHGELPTSDELMDSFQRTVKLAQSAASSINITWTGGGQDHPDKNMKDFADVLAGLVKGPIGATKLRWATIMNEPNSTKIPLADYEAVYRRLRFHLNKQGVGRQIRLMGGDLVQTKQEKWCGHLAHNMSDVLDAWSIHVYWDYDQLGPGLKTKLRKRLKDVQDICNAIDKEGLKSKPVYVTEYGVRGTWKEDKKIVRPEPGTDKKGRRVVNLNLNAFQHAWFNLEAANRGYRGLVKWDAYFAKYDLKPQPFPQEYGMLGKPKGADWQLRPSYHLTRLFTQTVRPGWNVRNVEQDGGSQIVAAYSAPSGDGLTLIGLDTAGASLDKAPQERPYHFSKLPGNTSFQLLYWNRGGQGQLRSAGKAKTDAAGNLTVEAPLQSVFALTTLPVTV